MYIVYCQNKPKSEHIVSEYIDTFFEVSAEVKIVYVCFLSRKGKSVISSNLTVSLLSQPLIYTSWDLGLRLLVLNKILFPLKL